MDFARAFVAMATLSCVLAACSARTTASGEDGSTGTGDGSSSGGGSTSTSTSSSGGGSTSTSSSGDGTSSGSTSSTSSSGTDGTTDPDTGDGGAFIAEPDGGIPMPPCDPASMQRGLCDPLLQDCGNGEKCTPVSFVPTATWHTFRCAPLASDPKEVDETCSVFGAPNSGCDDCVAGAMCLFVYEDDGEGTCVAFCEPPWDQPTCAEPGKVCAMANNGALPVCLDSCNPLVPGCPPEAGCLYIDEIQDFVCGPWWTNLGYGEVCSTDLGSCATGLACVGQDNFPDGTCGGQCCTAACDLSAPNACPHAAEGQVCTALYEPGQAPPGNENVGLCKMP